MEEFMGPAFFAFSRPFHRREDLRRPKSIIPIPIYRTGRATARFAFSHHLAASMCSDVTYSLFDTFMMSMLRRSLFRCRRSSTVVLARSLSTTTAETHLQRNDTNKHFPHLFTPLELDNGVVLPNRVLMGSMHTGESAEC
jgi:hypothetical protein